jgi:hypothetical protein
VIAGVCASRDLKCELIRGYMEGKSAPVFRGRWFTPAGYFGGTKAGHPNLERECLSTEDRSHHIQGTRAVTKTLVARHELERIALQEIRSFPGCEYVTDIEVAYQVDRVLRTNWTIHVFTREGGDMLRIQYAINTTRKKLRHRYDLRPES